MQMHCKKIFCGFIFFVIGSTLTFGQDNTSLLLTDTVRKSRLPTIGIGFGITPYFGNVGYSNFSDPLRNKVSLGISVEEKIRDHFSVSYEFIFGKLYGNDKSVYSHNNFQANIVCNAVTFNYFPLSEKKRFLKPYLLAGIGALYYKTFVDNTDGKNMPYNYWSDNTIRNLPENSSNTQNATVTGRDYTYETQVNKGAITLTLPIGFGVNFQISNKLSLNLGPTLYYTFTKKIDNVPSAKTGLGFNDRFVYASFSFRYNFGAPAYKNPNDEKYAQVNFGALENADTDGDGIVDRKDQCPNTPVEVKVDGHGCPIDSDKDGVPDFKDKEVNSKSGVAVDDEGIELTDEYIARKESARVLRDSLDALKPHAEFHIPEPGIPETFYVQLGSYKNGIPPDMVDKYLAVPDVKTKMGEDSLVQYSTGPFADITAAESKKNELVKSGIKEAYLAGFDKEGREVDLEKYLPSNQGFYVSNKNATVDSSGSISRTEATPDAVTVKAEKENARTLYKVQLGAFGKSTNKSVFDGIKDLSSEKMPNGNIRYFAGSFVSKEEANKYRDKLRKNGFETSFTIAFKDEKPVPNMAFKEEEGAEVSNNDHVVFKVQLGAFKDFVANEKVKDLENVTKEPIEGSNLTRLLTGSFKSFEQAFAMKEKIKKNEEFKAAYVVAYKGKKRVKISQVIPARVNEEAAKSAYKKPASTVTGKKEIHFKIQLGIFRAEVPADILATYLTLKDVEEDKTPSGLTRFTSGSFEDIAAANAYKDEVIAKGVKGAFVIAFKGKKYMPLQEAIDASTK